MKKFFFVVGSVLFVALSVKAQTTRLGVKAGLNVAGLKVTNGNDYEGKAGFYTGGLVHIHLTRHFAVQPELVYSMQGGVNGDLSRKQNYINLPAIAQYMTGSGFRFQTGPQIGFLVSAEDEVGKVQVDVKDQLKKADLSWVVGASYLSKTGVGVDARYNFGITNINEAESPKTRNMVFQVGAFYQFNH